MLIQFVPIVVVKRYSMKTSIMVLYYDIRNEYG